MNLLRFPERPTLVVAAEEFPTQEVVLVEDPEAPGGRRLSFTGFMPNLLHYLSQAINFTYNLIIHLNHKYSHGCIQEADIGLGPFGISSSRAEFVEFMWPIFIAYSWILAGRGRPEVDPWSFLLPLSPLVWTFILTALLAMATAVFLLTSYFTQGSDSPRNKNIETFSLVRILFQQDYLVVGGGWRWWERLVLGVWMMMTLVLTRSYAGNLMSLLAVRHIPQPYHTLRDVLDDPAVTMIWESNYTNVQYFRYIASSSSEKNIFRKQFICS
ncbi:probable glutamate receptor [Panulirus ornatus]|uniref:probable glutamate receptor n=1 Tax=Panulirus ornatus TaxID=150431 RepID=UPI003A837F8E